MSYFTCKIYDVILIMNISIIKLFILKKLIGLNFGECDTRTKRERKWERSGMGTGTVTVRNGNGTEQKGSERARERCVNERITVHSRTCLKSGESTQS